MYRAPFEDDNFVDANNSEVSENAGIAQDDQNVEFCSMKQAELLAALIGETVDESIESIQTGFGNIRKAWQELFMNEQEIIDSRIREQYPNLEQYKYSEMQNEINIGHKDSYPNAGLVAVVSKDALTILKDYIAPLLISRFMGLEIGIGYKFSHIVFQTVAVNIPSLDISQVEIEMVEEINALVLKFPVMIVELNFKVQIDLGTELEGTVYARQRVDNPKLLIQFFEDPGTHEPNFYKPKIRLFIENLDLNKYKPKLKADIEYIPTKIFNAMLRMIRKKVFREIQDYMETPFIRDGSDILNWTIERKYPSIINPLKDDSYISMLITQRPRIRDDLLYIYAVGEFFHLSDVQQEHYTPSESPETVPIPIQIDEGNFKVGMSQTNLKKAIHTMMNQKVKKVEVAEKWRIKKLKFLRINVMDSNMSIDEEGIHLEDMKLLFFEEDPKAVFESEGRIVEVKWTKKINLSLAIDSYNIQTGLAIFRILKLKFFLEANNPIYNYCLQKANSLISWIVHQKINGKYEIKPFNPEQGISVKFHNIEYFPGVVFLEGKVFNVQDGDRRMII